MLWLLMLTNFAEKCIIPMVPFINATIPTVGQKMFNQPVGKNSQEISYTRVNQHTSSILRLGETSSNKLSFSWLLFSFSGSVPHLRCVNARLKRGKPSHKKKLACLVYNWLLVSTHLKNISQIGSFPPKYG